jgi:hypothetical protein
MVACAANRISSAPECTRSCAVVAKFRANRRYHGRMPTTPEYALVHVFLPNHTKLKGAGTIVSSLERRDKTHLAQVWAQAHVTHDPEIATETRDPYRIAVVSLPPPKDMGEAYLAAWVIKKSDPAFTRFFTLEYDYVLAKKANRTVLCERTGTEHKKHGDGPAMSGNFAADAKAFADAFIAVLAKPSGTVPR